MNVYWNKMFGLGLVVNRWCCLDDNDHSRSRMCLEFRVIIFNLMICGTFPIGKWKKRRSAKAFVHLGTVI